MVLDAGSDEAFGARLAAEWLGLQAEGKLTRGVGLKVWYEHTPAAPEGVFPSTVRNAGYAQQQWSNFYGEVQVDTEVAGIMDSDAFFIAPVLPSTLVTPDGKVVALGRTHGPCGHDCWDRGTGDAYGRKQVANFMIAFPVSIHASTFPVVRGKIMDHLTRFETFEHAYKWLASSEGWSQFCMMMNGAYWFHHDVYDWHLEDYFPEAETKGTPPKTCTMPCDDGACAGEICVQPGDNSPVVRLAQHKRPPAHNAQVTTCCKVLAHSAHKPAETGRGCQGVDPDSYYLQSLSYIFEDRFEWVPWETPGRPAQQTWDAYVAAISQAEAARPSLLDGCRKLLGVPLLSDP